MHVLKVFYMHTMQIVHIKRNWSEWLHCSHLLQWKRWRPGNYKWMFPFSVLSLASLTPIHKRLLREENLHLKVKRTSPTQNHSVQAFPSNQSQRNLPLPCVKSDISFYCRLILINSGLWKSTILSYKTHFSHEYQTFEASFTYEAA